MNNKSWYDIKGLPYTLGFLFYGNPGCGKTSMIKAIANITQRHIININFSNIKKKSQLKQLFYDIDLLCTNNYTTEILKIPIKDRLYVFEDIDCVNNIKVLKQRDFKKPATKAEGPKIKPDKKFDHLSQQMFNSNNVTNEEEEDDDDIDLSTVLNILDGTLENPNRIIIFTSNFPEILDKALIRPGRIDMMIEFKLASHKIIIDMYKSYYEEEPDSELVNNIPEEFWTPAELSQIYFNNLDNPKNSLEFLANKDNKIIFQAKNMVVEEPVAQVAPKISICDLNDNVDFPQNIMDFINMNKAKQENKENKIISNDLMAHQVPQAPTFCLTQAPQVPKVPQINIMDKYDETTQIDFPTLFKPQKQLDFIISTKTHFINNDDCLNKINIETKEIPEDFYSFYDYNYICDYMRKTYDEDFGHKYNKYQNNKEPLLIIKHYFDYIINNEEWDYDEKSAILITFKKSVPPSTNNDIILEINKKWNKSIVCMFNMQMDFNSWFNIIDINKIELFEDLIENILFFSNTKAFVNYYMNNMDIISAFVYICNKCNMPQVTIPKDIFYFYYDYTFTKNEINEDFNTYNTFESYIEYLRENITLNLKQANDLLNNKIVKLELVLEADIETSIYDNCSINYSKLLNIINEQTDNELKFYIREIL
jgi:hypothetical protein